jgi:hypothetical protein
MQRNDMYAGFSENFNLERNGHVSQLSQLSPLHFFTNAHGTTRSFYQASCALEHRNVLFFWQAATLSLFATYKYPICYLRHSQFARNVVTTFRLAKVD